MPRHEPDPNPKLGPKMNALVPKRRMFVQALMNQGTRNAASAYRAAGYSTASDLSVRVNASILMHDEAVQEAIQEEARRRITSMLPLAVETIATIMENPQEGGATRTKAALSVMDRAGIHAVSERITSEGMDRNPDQFQRILGLAQIIAKAAGVSVENIIGDRLKAPIMITDAVEVPMNSMEGLEGLV